MRKQSLVLMISLVLAGGLATSSAAFAQDGNPEPETPANAERPTERLADRHGEAAGSTESAIGLVTGLRAGGDFTLGDTLVTNPNEAMGYGEVDIALSIASALVESGAYADLASALGGDVLAMRAEGMGWGEIAAALDFNLGQLMSAGRRPSGAGETEASAEADASLGIAGNANASANANAQVGLDRAAAARANTGGGIGIGARPERPAIPARPALPERAAAPPRPEPPPRPGRGGG